MRWQQRQRRVDQLQERGGFGSSSGCMWTNARYLASSGQGDIPLASHEHLPSGNDCSLAQSHPQLSTPCRMQQSPFWHRCIGGGGEIIGLDNKATILFVLSLKKGTSH